MSRVIRKAYPRHKLFRITIPATLTASGLRFMVQAFLHSGLARNVTHSPLVHQVPVTCLEKQLSIVFVDGEVLTETIVLFTYPLNLVEALCQKQIAFYVLCRATRPSLVTISCSGNQLMG